MERARRLTAQTKPSSLRRERNLILAGLAALTVAAWAVVIGQARPAMSGMGMTMGMAAPVFLAAWVAMMAAMMFPAVAPMILTFARMQAGRRSHGVSAVPTSVFVAGYLIVWAVFGLLAYTAATAVDTMAVRQGWSIEFIGRATGLLFVLAGVYQLTPLRRACLGRCRSPLAFLASSWRDGLAGALRMGVEHGITCLGCCWALFLLLFPVGVMNIAAMIALTLLVFAEKTSPLGARLSRFSTPALIAFGVVLVQWPHALPVSI